MLSPAWPPGMAETDFTYSTIPAPNALPEELPLGQTTFGRAAAAILGKLKC
jgi:hypothetical protein